MAKKIVKKKKVRLSRLLILIAILFSLFFAVYFYINTPIRNIIISGTTHIRDDDLLALAEIIDYPSFWFTRRSAVEEKLLTHPLVESVEVRKEFFNVIRIDITENRAMLFNDSTNTITFSNEETIDRQLVPGVFRIPRLLNNVPEEQYKILIRELAKLNPSILGKISEIEYRPNDFDQDRFLLFMDDGNLAYVTLTKFNMIDLYNDIVVRLGGNRGILFLDSGNHFRIME